MLMMMGNLYSDTHKNVLALLLCIEWTFVNTQRAEKVSETIQDVILSIRRFNYL